MYLVAVFQYLDLSGNKIRSMNGLQRHQFLGHVNLEDNEVTNISFTENKTCFVYIARKLFLEFFIFQIIDLGEIQYLRSLTLLRDLNLQRNPIREVPDYRLSIIFHLQDLTELDRRRVEVEEKVSAINMFNPPLEVIAARDHIMHVVYSFLQPSKILDW